MSEPYTVHLTSAHAPNGVGEWHWEHPDTVVAVPDDIAVQLLRIPSGGFEQVEPYDARPPVSEKKAPSLVEQIVGEPLEVEHADHPPLQEALDLTANAPQKETAPRKAARARKAT